LAPHHSESFYLNQRPEAVGAAVFTIDTVMEEWEPPGSVCVLMAHNPSNPGTLVAAND
jgi:hypothetical protein